jgi:hypothetical protein
VPREPAFPTPIHFAAFAVPEQRRENRFMILTEEQRRDLEPLAGDGGYDRSPAARARMVLWRDEGYSARETAEKAGTSKDTVYYWWRRYDR